MTNRLGVSQRERTKTIYWTSLINDDSDPVAGHEERAFQEWNEVEDYTVRSTEFTSQFGTIAEHTLDVLRKAADRGVYQDNEIDLVFPRRIAEYTGYNLKIEGSPTAE